MSFKVFSTNNRRAYVGNSRSLQDHKKGRSRHELEGGRKSGGQDRSLSKTRMKGIRSKSGIAKWDKPRPAPKSSDRRGSKNMAEGRRADVVKSTGVKERAAAHKTRRAVLYGPIERMKGRKKNKTLN